MRVFLVSIIFKRFAVSDWQTGKCEIVIFITRWITIHAGIKNDLGRFYDVILLIHHGPKFVFFYLK